MLQEWRDSARKFTKGLVDAVKSNGMESVAESEQAGVDSGTANLRIVSVEPMEDQTQQKILSGPAEIATNDSMVAAQDGENDSAHRLARLLQALDDCDKDFAAIRTDYKARRENLQNQIWILRSNILSGQVALPLEN